ncbi:MAG: FecR domain-containing protein [Bacteroidales bacterium]|nr:FecR domain-containing protein [Bacteroidales bacterium]
MEQDTFIKYFSGTISPQEEVELLEWIDESEENRKEYLEQRQVWDMYILHQKPEDMAMNFDQLIEKRRPNPENKHPKPPVKGKIRLREFIKIAAIFLIAFGVGKFFVPSNNEVQYHTIEVPPGQRVKLTLSDGSQVWLNAQTKFTYPATFNEEKRVVMLDGEGLFDVVHDKKKSFIVQTLQHEIKVLGTSFNVYAYSNNPFFGTTLIGGSVQVTDQQNPGNIYQLSPGEQLFYNDFSKKLEIKKVETSEYTSWKDGIHYFNDISFAEMTERLSHFYNTKIIINDSSVLNYHCTGKFRQKESITEIMDVVKSDIPFTYIYDKENNELRIEKK